MRVHVDVNTTGLTMALPVVNCWFPCTHQQQVVQQLCCLCQPRQHLLVGLVQQLQGQPGRGLDSQQGIRLGGEQEADSTGYMLCMTLPHQWDVCAAVTPS
jgi:hypothetical protein